MKDINIIYEDNHLLIVEKPVNIPVQQDNTNDLDLLTILKKYIKEKYNKPGNVYLGLVHRLDRPVGGVMIFARTSKCASRISEQIRKGNIDKWYLAVVNKKVEKQSDILEDYILRDEKNNISKIVPKETNNSKYAKLEYEVLDYNKEKDLTLVKIHLFTGRHHQIRLQFNNIGHSLYGDQRYGKQDKKQIALWAYKIEFNHPITNERISFSLLPKNIGIWNEFKIEE